MAHHFFSALLCFPFLAWLTLHAELLVLEEENRSISPLSCSINVSIRLINTWFQIWFVEKLHPLDLIAPFR